MRETERAQPHAGLRHLEVMRGFLLGDRPGTVRCYEAGPGTGGALIEFALAEDLAPAEPDVEPPA